ncbi:hypothetical protein FRC01_001953, partial [Tulasnella sp. 417]
RLGILRAKQAELGALTPYGRQYDLPVEILLCIFERIQTSTVDGITRTRESDLASSALVCKLWNEVATECLWQELPSALCLLSLLGEMTYEEPDGWRYANAINNPNLDRFRYLANLVLRLNHSNSAQWESVQSSKINIDAIHTAFQWFTFQSDSDTLLPRVKTISWDTQESYPSSQVPYFISSCLQHLSFKRTSLWLYERPGGDLERGIEIFKSLIQKRCQLIHLSFTIPWKLSEIPSSQATLLDFASTQTQLHSISLEDWITEPLLGSLVGARNKLVSLNCWVDRGEGETFGRTMGALSTGFSALRELEVYVTGGDMTDDDFKQFLQLRSLRQIRLDTFGFPRLGETDVEAMSRAWPDIEEFVALHRGLQPGDPHPLSILSAFARWMGPSIQVLGLDLDAAADPPPNPTDNFKFIKLRELRIGSLSPPPHDPEEVTKYLQGLFLSGQPSFKLSIHDWLLGMEMGWEKVRSSFERGNVAPNETHRKRHLPVEILFWIVDSIQTSTTENIRHTRESDLASSALVCKLWKEVATECLWRELPSALCLLRLLGELTYKEPDGWAYISPINNPNSDRFSRLANLVLQLNHSNSARWETIGSSKINIDTIQGAYRWFTFRTGSNTLVPRVGTISWDTCDIYPSSEVPYFISNCLQHLSFSRTGWMEGSDGDVEYGIDIFRSLIRKRCQLIHLSFHFAWKFSRSHSLQTALSEFTSTQTQLRSIKLRDWMNEALLESVAGTRNTLVSLRCSTNRQVGVTFGRMMDSLSTDFNALQELDVNVVQEGVEDEGFKRLLQVRSLCRITLRVISFPKLEEADVEAMSRFWPDVEKFAVKLLEYPPQSLQSLSILSAFAKWVGTTIQILELDFDAAAEPPVIVDSFKFVELRELRIGKLGPAPHDPEEEVARYLRSISLHGPGSFRDGGK